MCTKSAAGSQDRSISAEHNHDVSLSLVKIQFIGRAENLEFDLRLLAQEIDHNTPDQLHLVAIRATGQRDSKGNLR